MPFHTFTVIWLGAAYSSYMPVDKNRKTGRRKWSSAPTEGRLLILDIHSRKTVLGRNGRKPM